LSFGGRRTVSLSWLKETLAEVLIENRLLKESVLWLTERRVLSISTIGGRGFGRRL
jgi:hypothetical protein